MPTNQEMALSYYKAGMLQGRNKNPAPRPKYVPKLVAILRTVRADFNIPGEKRSFVEPGEYEVSCNPLGAVSVISPNSGKKLGLMPDEFEVIEWTKNPHYKPTV